MHWQVRADRPYAVQFGAAGVLTSLLSELQKGPTEQLKYSLLSEPKETIFPPSQNLICFSNGGKKKKRHVVYYCVPRMSEEIHRKCLAHMVFLCGLFFSLVCKSAQNHYHLAHSKRKSPVHNMI